MASLPKHVRCAVNLSLGEQAATSERMALQHRVLVVADIE